MTGFKLFLIDLFSTSCQTVDHRKQLRKNLWNLKKSTVTAVTVPEQLIHILGIVYAHHKTPDGGDMYLTQFGLQYSDLPEIEKLVRKGMAEARRERLEGTSAVYKIRNSPQNTLKTRNKEILASFRVFRGQILPKIQN
jgi:hypothetical protein